MACSFCPEEKSKCSGQCPNCSDLAQLNKKRVGSEAAGASLGTVYSHGVITLKAHGERQITPTTHHVPFDVLGAVDAFALYNSSNEALDIGRADTTPDEPDSPNTPFGYSGLDSFAESQEDQIHLAVYSKSPSDLSGLIQLSEDTWLTEDAKLELTELFFDEVYPNIPIIHRSRYYTSINLAPHLQPPLCLRFAMWALVAVQNQKWSRHANWLYEKARTYLEQDESHATGSEVLNVAHVQCWSLIATYESYMFLSLRTWSSIRRAAALAQVLRLHTVDEDDDSSSPLLPETQDPQELEERRRAFWSAFSSDRWISSTTGLPTTMPEWKITTKLPSSEVSFNCGLIQQTQSLDDALKMGLDQNTSLYGARAVLACILGRVMRHVESAKGPMKKSNVEKFWTQHAELDNLLGRVSRSRGSELRPTTSTTDLKLWVLDMWLHGLKICLHQTAIDRATNQSDHKQYAESLGRCRDAADHVISSIKSIAHLETRKMDPFTASCVYMAGTVLIQGYTHGTSRTTDIQDLRYLQQVLELMHQHWKVTEVFINQFKEDIANSGINLLLKTNKTSAMVTKKRLGDFESSNRHRRIKSVAAEGNSA